MFLRHKQLTCPELNFSSRLATDKIFEVLHSQDEGRDLGSRPDTGLPTALRAVPPCVVKQQHLPYELPGSPQGYDGPGLAASAHTLHQDHWHLPVQQRWCAKAKAKACNTVLH